MLKGQRLILQAIERGDLPRCAAWLNTRQVTDHLKICLPFNFDNETDWHTKQRQDSLWRSKCTEK